MRLPGNSSGDVNCFKEAKAEVRAVYEVTCRVPETRGLGENGKVGDAPLQKKPLSLTSDPTTTSLTCQSTYRLICQNIFADDTIPSSSKM